MERFIKRFVPYAAVLGLLVGASGQVRAETIVYTFEPPRFTPLQFTPLLNVAPNSGPSTVLASFTSAPNPFAFQVAPFLANGLFSGNSLVEPLGVTGNTLSIALNQPAIAVALVFATNGPGSLQLTSPVGGTTVTSTPQSGGAGFPGGTLSFSSATPFSTFSLAALPPAGGRLPEFAIDNLTLTPIPEPSTLVMGVTGALIGLGYTWRRRRAA